MGRQLWQFLCYFLLAVYGYLMDIEVYLVYIVHSYFLEQSHTARKYYKQPSCKLKLDTLSI